MTVYTVPGCGRCKILKTKLDRANIEYTESQDVNRLIEAGFHQAPVLQKDDGELIGFKEALDYLNSISA